MKQKKRLKYFRYWICWALTGVFALAGCSQESGGEKIRGTGEYLQESAAEKNYFLQKGKDVIEKLSQQKEITEADWAEYFDGLNGAAVVYNASNRQYAVYQEELALSRHSPCSTFKIISSLIALEKGIIKPGQSLRSWSGETFWNESWNQDMDFDWAFRNSCVWYFREVIDEIGQETMQEELDRLSYGNGDISDWAGERNQNNNNRALTGFWIESSLEISPREQTEVMERIFGKNSLYSEETQKELKQVMLVSEQKTEGISIYGKTGMGKVSGITVDAWFTGFAESGGENIYFCVYLGRTDGRDVTSAEAREIAVQIITDYCEKK